ncbi:MAG TPA: DUF6272 family protein, partial [Spirochaetota bacterium]|nr:DUF6272 family protein [Spirochaetota bacterium]
MINYENGTIGYLDITFGPKWDYIPVTRTYIETFLSINIEDKLKITKISMSASELLENAVKYSNKDGIRLIIKKSENKHSIELIVYNFAKKDDAIKLMDYVNQINSVEDKFIFYVEKMKEPANKKEGKSGLGLARIAYEGGATIKIAYTEDKQSNVIVETKVLFNF